MSHVCGIRVNSCVMLRSASDFMFLINPTCVIGREYVTINFESRINYKCRYPSYLCQIYSNSINLIKRLNIIKNRFFDMIKNAKKIVSFSCKMIFKSQDIFLVERDSLRQRYLYLSFVMIVSWYN